MYFQTCPAFHAVSCMYDANYNSSHLIYLYLFADNMQSLFGRIYYRNNSCTVGNQFFA